MTKLLCALMVASKCVMFHPKGTKPGPVPSIGTTGMRSYSGAKRTIVAYGNEFGYWPSYEPNAICQHQHVAAIVFIRLGRQTSVEWSCTNEQIDAWADKKREATKLSPMGAYNKQRAGQ